MRLNWHNAMKQCIKRIPLTIITAMMRMKKGIPFYGMPLKSFAHYTASTFAMCSMRSTTLLE